MTLSIIIVNYNVRYFLEHCLFSVQKALQHTSGEVIVVDNNSSDGSIEYLSSRFPAVNFIASGANNGFAKACNIGLEKSSGEYILFLNPDTIVPEDAFNKCLEFFQEHADCGALGVKMVDGSGTFLRESKRAFPSPITSLYKLFGLGRLFPKSQVFNRYHLGHLNHGDVNAVDVLAGAYMMVRRDLLQKVGSFDERFFMYGEDVDLSYRIQQAGFKNYYFPEVTIIHFKGESTRRSSLNYVRMFYNAMSIFVNKHYGGTRAGVYNIALHIAIWLRATIAAISKLISRIGFPIVDGLLMLFSFWLVKTIWIEYVRPDLELPEKLLWISLPAYSILYVAVAYYAGLYDRYYKTAHLIRSTFIATAALLIIYSLLPETFRFSRGIVLFGAMVGMFLIAIYRWLMYNGGFVERAISDSSKPFILIAGTEEEFTETTAFLQQAGIQDKVIGRVAINGNGEDAVGEVQTVVSTARSAGAREIIFCAGKLSYKEIIGYVQQIGDSVTIRFHHFSAGSIVGSDTGTAAGHIVSPEAEFNLAKPSNRRMKRLVDVVTSLFFLLTFPVHLVIVPSSLKFLRNCFGVLAGRYTWIGYILQDDKLPQIRAGVLTHNETRPASNFFNRNLHQLDYWYARNYDPVHDVKVVLKNYRRLGG